MQADTTLAPTEREQFEAWVRSEFPGVKLRRKGKFYNHPPTSEWWLIWQAARAQPAPQGPALVPLTDEEIERMFFSESAEEIIKFTRALERRYGITGAPNGKPT